MLIELYTNSNAISKESINEIRSFDSENISDFICDPFTFICATVHSGDSIVGAGIIRVINEFKMTLNPKLSSFMKAKVLKVLIDEGIKRKQCNEIVVSITKGGNHYKDILYKHYGFEEDLGSLMRLEL